MQLIKITVETDAKEESVREGKDRLMISVRELAEEGRANARVLELVRARFPGQPIRIVHGHHAPHKTISVG